MKIRGAKNNAALQQSQGVTPGKEAAAGTGGNSANLRQEFQGLLATFAGRVKDPSSSISLDTFQVEEIPAEDAVAPIEKISEPTAVQTATQASAAAPVKQELQNDTPEQQELEQQPEADALALADSCKSAPVREESLKQPAAQQTQVPATEADEGALQSLPQDDADAALAPAIAPAVEAEMSEISEQPTGESYAQPQEQAPLSETAIGEEVAAGATADAPAEVQTDAVDPVTTEPAQPVEAAQAAHPVSQPKGTGARQEIKPGAAVAPGTVVTSPVQAAPVGSEESAGQGVKEQVHQAISNFLEAFTPKEIAPKDSAQSSPGISVLAQLLKQSMASEMAGSAIKSAETTSQNAAAERVSSASQMNPGTTPIGAASASRALSNENRPVRPLPAAQATRILERVEQTLKEVARSKDGKSISLTLTPNDLGTVKVDVTLKQGMLHARLGAETAQVSQLLRERAPELQSMLRKLGLNVDKVSVSVHSEGQSFSQMHDQLERHNSQRGNQGGGNGLGFTGSGASLPAAAMQQEKSVKLDHWVA